MEGNMKLLVYKNKETLEISGYEVLRRDIQKDALERYNADNKNIRSAEVIEVEKGSLLYYVITAKQRSLSDYLEDIRNIENLLNDISSDIDDKLYDLEMMIKSEGGEE